MTTQTLQIRSPLSQPLDPAMIVLDVSELYRHLVREVIDLTQRHQETDLLPESACLDLMEAIDYREDVITSILLELLNVTFNNMLDGNQLIDWLADLEIDLVIKLNSLNVFKSNQNDVSRFISSEIISAVYTVETHGRLKDVLEDLSYDVELSTINAFELKTHRSPYTGTYHSVLRVLH